MSNFLIKKLDNHWYLDKERQIHADTIEEVINSAVANFRLQHGEFANPFSLC